MVPPGNESNHYLSSLITGLENEDVSVLNTRDHTAFPLIGPIVSNGRPDVVHIHWLHRLYIGSTFLKTVLKSSRLIIELTVLSLIGISIVWTVHNLTDHKDRYSRLDRVFRILLSNIYFDHLIVHCKEAERLVRSKYALRAGVLTSVIPHGHYINQYTNSTPREEARSELGIDTDRFVFLFFGRIRRYKQIPMLIQVFDDLEIPEAELVIAGNPASDDLYRKIHNLSVGCADVTTRLEFIPDTDVERYFAAADVTVFPYQDILTSGSAILSLSLGCPVIAPHIGCLPELIQDCETGFLYEDSIAGLNEAMRRATDVDINRMSRNALSRASDFGWKGIASQTRSVYEA